MSTTRKALFTLAALGLTAFAVHPAFAQSTLTGTFFQAPMGTISTIAQAQAFIASHNATGTFTSTESILTNGGYSGTDNSTVPIFLGNDGPSFKGPLNTNLQDGIFDFNGLLNVTTPGMNTYNFATSSDDGSALFIDGTEIVNDDGLHGVQFASGNDTLSAGNHQIELVYFNHGFGSGGANFAAGFAGFGTSPASAAPEPSQVGMLALVALGLGALAVRARKRSIAAQTV